MRDSQRVARTKIKGTPDQHQHNLKGRKTLEVCMSKPLTVTLHIGGKQVETLTPEQREVVAQRLSKAMSLYYTAHPEEYQNLKINRRLK